MTTTSHLQDDLLLPDKWVIMQISPMLPSKHIWEQNVLAHVLQADSYCQDCEGAALEHEVPFANVYPFCYISTD